MTRIAFTIFGKPFAKKRSRFSRKTARAFNPHENTVAENSLGAVAAIHFPKPFTGPVKLEIIATFAIPASWSKAKKAALAYRHHTQKPDCDNIGKWVCDGLNRIAWADDCQVAEITVRKSWGPNDQTTIFVEAAE